MRRMKAILVAGLMAVILLAGALPGSAAETAAEHRAEFRKGAQLWPVYCAQCHKARPGAQYSPEEWDLVMMHMRTRANLTGEDARAVLTFLKAR
jgi:mono/diheme cytochrome c family protein